MLLFILVFIGCASKIKVSVQGFVPKRLSSQEYQIINATSEEPDYYIISQSHIRDKPANIPQICKFESRYPKFFIYIKNNGDFVKSPTISIDSETSGSYELSALLFSHNYSVGMFIGKTKFIISDKNTINDPEYSLYNGKEFDFIQSNRVSFYLFGMKNEGFAKMICKPFRDAAKWLMLLEVFSFAIIILILLYSRFASPLHFNDKITLWFYDKNGNSSFGPSLDVVDELTQYYIKKATSRSIKTLQNTSYIISISRLKDMHSYKRVYCDVVHSNFFITFVFTEFFNDPVNLTLNFEFKSEENKLISAPEMRFLTFQNFRPFILSYYITNQVHCSNSLPASIFTPFQPSGRILTMVMSFLYKLTTCLHQNPFIQSNFFDITNFCCQLLDVSASFFYNYKGRLIYSVQNLKNLDESGVDDSLQNSYIFSSKFKSPNSRAHLVPNAIIAGLPSQVKNVPSESFVRSLIDPGDYCYVIFSDEVLSITQFKINMEKNACEEIALPLMLRCCAFMFRVCKAQKSSLKYRRFITTLSRSRMFSLFEKSLKLNRIYSFELDNDPAFNQKIKILIDSFPNQAKFLPITHRIVQFKDDQESCIALTVNKTQYKNDPIVSFLVENAFELKRKYEYDILDKYADLLSPTPILGLRKFNIINRKPLLLDDSIYKELNREIPESKENYWLDKLVHPNDIECIDSILSTTKMAIRLENNNGEPIWYAIICDGQTGFIFPITTIFNLYNQMQTTDKNLQLAASGSSLTFWCVDPIEDTVHSMLMQPTIWDTLNVDSDTKFSKFIDFLDDEDKELYRSKMDLLYRGEISNWSEEVRIIRNAGQHEWYHLVIAKSKNKVLQCLALNVNKQKENEMKLRETQNLRDLLLTSGKLILWKFNDDHSPIKIFRHFDPGITSTVEMNWTFVDSKVHPDYREAFHKKMEHALEFDETFELSVPLLFDEPIWVSMRGKANSSTRQVVGVCIDITELQMAYSELEKEKKRAEEANRQKTIFLANMSHEIRTPMNGIFGILDVLALRNLTSEQRQLVETIHASSTQLMKLLDDTLNLSKIEQGDIESNPIKFHIGKVLEPICVATASRAQTIGINFHSSFTSNVPALVYGDPQLISQILNNLLSNSLKFTKEGFIDVNISWEINNDTEFCIITVEDSGIGISEEQQTKLFQRFQQADDSTARIYGGTGLGLALVQEITRFLGGSIYLKSKPNEGSKFTVEIPMISLYNYFAAPFLDGKKHIVLLSLIDEKRKQMIEHSVTFMKYDFICFSNEEELKQHIDEAEIIIVEEQKELANRVSAINKNALTCAISNPGETSPLDHNFIKPVLPYRIVEFLNEFRYSQHKKSKTNTDSNKQLELEKNEKKGKHILVVEDNQTNQFVMKKILQNLGCSLMVADNGKIALDLLEKNKFDLVFMDCQMPVMDGIEATKNIRNSKSSYSNIPIIALTASAVEGDEQTCLNAGMNGYLAKPVRVKQIQQAIQKYGGLTP